MKFYKHKREALVKKLREEQFKFDDIRDGVEEAVEKFVEVINEFAEIADHYATLVDDLEELLSEEGEE